MRDNPHQRQFVDTNVFLNACDLSKPVKQKQAEKLISTL